MLDLHLVAGVAAEESEGGVEGDEDEVVAVLAEVPPLLLHHPDDGHRQAADVDLLADRLSPSPSSSTIFCPITATLRRCADVDAGEEPAAVDVG